MGSSLFLRLFVISLVLLQCSVTYAEGDNDGVGENGDVDSSGDDRDNGASASALSPAALAATAIVATIGLASKLCRMVAV